MSTRTKALLAIIVVSLLWATAPASAKILLREYTPLQLGFLRLGIASLVMLPLFFKYNKTPLVTLIHDVVPVALLTAVNFLVFLFGVQWTSANASTLIYTATPLLSLSVAHYFIREYATRQKLAGVLIGLLGVGYILFLPTLESAHAAPTMLLGNILMFIGAFSWAMYIVGSRHIIAAKGYSPIVTTTVSMIISWLAFTVLLTFSNQTFPPISRVAAPLSLLTLLYFSVGVTVVTYVLHQWAIKHSSATTASLTSYLQPVFGVVVNAFVLTERITPTFFVGSILVLLGIFISDGSKMLRRVRGGRS